MTGLVCIESLSFFRGKNSSLGYALLIHVAGYSVWVQCCSGGEEVRGSMGLSGK